MSPQNADAIQRIVEAFEQGSMLPEDMDLDSPEMKALIEFMPESRRNTFLAMAKDPDVRKMSAVFNRGLGKYWRSLLSAKELGKKVVFVPFNFAPEIFHALDMIPVCPTSS
jgi:hypothetical protein